MSRTLKDLQEHSPYTYGEGLLGTKGLLPSRAFVLCAGAVVFNEALDKVCVLTNEHGECFLPKGRKDVGEGLVEAALREVYEETGFWCKLLPVTMLSRATPVGDVRVYKPDVVRVCKGATEPVAIEMRPGIEGHQKVIFWFLAVVERRDEMAIRGEGEDFDVDFLSFKEALERLTFESDQRLVQGAIDMVRSS